MTQIAPPGNPSTPWLNQLGDHLRQGSLCLGVQAQPSEAVSVTSILWVHFGPHDFRLSLEVQPLDPHKDFEASEERHAPGEPKLRATLAYVYNFANQWFGRPGIRSL